LPGEKLNAAASLSLSLEISTHGDIFAEKSRYAILKFERLSAGNTFCNLYFDEAEKLRILANISEKLITFFGQHIL
jgi:hypothetical protein